MNGGLLAGISGFRRRKSSAMAFSSEVATGSREENASRKTESRLIRGGSSAQQPADDPRGIIHRRDHPGIVEPRRSDHAKHADDMAGAVAVGRDDGGRAGQRKQFVFRSDENPHAVGAVPASP